MSLSDPTTRPAVFLALLGAWAAVPDRARADPPEVVVSRVVARDLPDAEDFTGRVEAARSVALRARVSGEVVKVAFSPGAAVKKGDLLFEIDPRVYRAELDKAEAELSGARARLKRRSVEWEGTKKLRENRVISQDEVARVEAGRDEAAAEVRAAEAVRDRARLNLEFTRVTAPIDGTVGEPALSAGNVAVADTTVLTRIVSPDSMSVSFDVDERTYLRVARQRREGGPKLSVAVALSGESEFPHRATLVDVATEVNPSTGTVRWRATLPNPDGLFLPGLSARVRLTLGPPVKTLLIAPRAILSDGAGQFVLVVTDRDVIERREARFGRPRDGLMEVREGLKEGDRVVLAGPNPNELLRPGEAVRPREVPMTYADPGSIVVPSPGAR